MLFFSTWIFCHVRSLEKELISMKSHIIIITIASCWIEVNNSCPLLNNRKYGENDAKKTCQLNLYPIINHGSYKSQSLIWHFWNPYFCKPCFTIFTICLTNPFASYGFVKLYNDRSMFLTTLGTPHKFLYLSQWIFGLECQTY
jgi:hypothetical protein